MPAVTGNPVSVAKERSPLFSKTPSHQDSFVEQKENFLDISPVILIGLMSSSKDHLMKNMGWRHEGEIVASKVESWRKVIREFYGINDRDLSTLISRYPSNDGPIVVDQSLEKSWKKMKRRTVK